MTIFGDGREFARLFEQGPAMERERQRNFDAALGQARDAALDVAATLLGVTEALPLALIATEKAEHERLRKAYGEDHPRTRELQARLVQLEALQGVEAGARARATRGLAALRRPGDALHGFVADEGGAPLPGLTVQLLGERLQENLQARTEDDGYFRIPLPDVKGSGGASEPAPNAARVVIKRRETTVYEDPFPFEVDGGAAYREYRIGTPPPRSPQAGARGAKRRVTRRGK
jgi:hypothetical protein